MRLSSYLFVLFLVPLFLDAQQPKTRTEQITQIRREKAARAWPERESPIAGYLNKLVERGLFEGFKTGKGANGLQLPVLGGMRSGNGMSLGVGYRRSDIWRDRIGMRTTFRGTFQKAYMMDFQTDFQDLRSDRSSLDIYVKYENSPQMDYYGQGSRSNRTNRTSYRLEDVGMDIRGSYRIYDKLTLGAKAGGLFVNTGPGNRSGFPSIEEVFNPINTPGLLDQSDFLRYGGSLQFDYRDNPRGPKIGGNYYADFTWYSDKDLREHSFGRLETVAEQYIPYFNRSRTIVLRLGAVMTFADDDQTVPYYLQPTLGGNEFLRGFARYRFYGNNSIMATVEHRWYVFAGLEAALFFEAGKVAQKIRFLNLQDLEYSGGIGLRFKIGESVFMRIDQAVSREGYRIMWTFNNVF